MAKKLRSSITSGEFELKNAVTRTWQLLVTLSLLSPRLVCAQQAPPDESVGIEEIVVTAQRREEKLKDVPISVQAASSEMLGQKATFDSKELATIIPSLNYAESSTAGASGFALRGVSSNAQTGSIQRSTALVVDGVPILRQGEFIRELSDVDRIEVLNGPRRILANARCRNLVSSGSHSARQIRGRRRV
jgi:outer membrane receptor protein involved in Fe transport